MKNTETKNTVKYVVVRVAIAFLVIVALLTYFSGTIESYLLPHVTVTYDGDGTLKHNLYANAVLEQQYAEDTGESVLRFRFSCDPSLKNYVDTGTVVTIKASVVTHEKAFAYREGAAVIVSRQETEEGFDCTAEVREIALKEDETMPENGDTVVIDTVFESEKFAHIVMKSAIRDNSYVFLVTKDKDGKRYIKRTPVTIIDESDFYAAVDIELEQLPYVLTASKVINDGQRVIVDG